MKIYNLLLNIVKKNPYPVGAIYMSVDSTNPSTLFGGTWTQIKDTFLLSAGDIYSAGTTGGEAAHTLNTDELPSHTHGNKSLTGYLDTYAWGDGVSSGIISKGTNAKNMTMSGGSTIGYIRYTTNASHEHNSVGQGASHNNMPPYLAVYIWKRIA